MNNSSVNTTSPSFVKGIMNKLAKSWANYKMAVYGAYNRIDQPQLCTNGEATPPPAPRKKGPLKATAFDDYFSSY